MSPKPLSLDLNPHVRISIQDQEDSPSFLVEAPIQGASLSSILVSKEHLVDAYAFLRSTLIDGHKDVLISEQGAAELRQIGLFVPTNAIPQTVAYQFPERDPMCAGTLRSCPSADGLSEQGAPQQALRLPDEWLPHALQFEPHHHDSVWAPVQIAPGAGSHTSQGTPISAVKHAETPLDEEATHAQFKHEGFAVLEHLLPAEHVREMGQYFQALASQGFLPCDENRGARRHFAHNHPVADFWHGQLNRRVSVLVGRQTKPSYSFVSLYLAGGDLLWHTDRPPCEYTITVLLDYTPLDVNDRSPWALILEGRDGTIHKLHQRVGEALIFRGRELMHCRDVLPDGHRSASLLFHFVNEDFDGELD